MKVVSLAVFLFIESAVGEYKVGFKEFTVFTYGSNVHVPKKAKY